MPIITVQVIEGRSDEQVKALIAEMTEVTARCLNVNAEQVRVLVHEVPAKHWGVGGKTKDELT